MRIRLAETADVEAIADLEAESFPADYWPAGYLREGVEGLLHGAVLHVAVDEDGVIVGHAITSIVFEIAELQRISVTPALRRRGVAGELLAAVRDEATRQGAERLLLEVRETNTGALAFYERAGFVEIDRRPRYYRDGTTAIILQMEL
jgi:ribosomal-protein-alanine N-acetyltransferase